MPYRGSYTSLQNGDDEQGTDGARRLQCQGRSGAPSVTIFLGELHASSSRALQQCYGKQVGYVYKGRHDSKIFHASELTMQSTLLAKIRSLHNLVKHVANSALGSLARQTGISHPKIDTPPPELLSFDTVL